LLMPETQITYAYNFFNKEYNDFETIISLMNYFSTSYMSVIIKLLEIGKLNDTNIVELVTKSQNDLIKGIKDHGINEDLLLPSQKDDTNKIIKKLESEGERLIEKELLSKAQLDKTISKVKKILKELSGK